MSAPTKITSALGWIAIAWALIWVYLYVVVSTVGVVREEGSDDQQYYWECRVRMDNPFAPWTQYIENRAKDAASCEELKP